MENLNLPEGTVRASLAAYTTEQEIDLLIAAVGEINRGRQGSPHHTIFIRKKGDYWSAVVRLIPKHPMQKRSRS